VLVRPAQVHSALRLYVANVNIVPDTVSVREKKRAKKRKTQRNPTNTLAGLEHAKQALQNDLPPRISSIEYVMPHAHPAQARIKHRACHSPCTPSSSLCQASSMPFSMDTQCKPASSTQYKPISSIEHAILHAHPVQARHLVCRGVVARH
jgi:hypothetical protein